MGASLLALAKSIYYTFKKEDKRLIVSSMFQSLHVYSRQYEIIIEAVSEI